MRLLQPLNRVVLEKIASDAKTLGQLLGRYHYYAFLLERFDEKQPEPDLQKERIDLEKLIRKRGRRLQRDATDSVAAFTPSRRKLSLKRISIFIDVWVSQKKKNRNSA